MERIVKLLTDAHRPVQILMAGKAHPKDDGGKHLIQEITKFALKSDVRSRIVFLEDYDLALARQLVQGVDIWLNTPRRPMEASGTSGMKVLANGGLNLSVPDGWWAEGYDSRASAGASGAARITPTRTSRTASRRVSCTTSWKKKWCRCSTTGAARAFRAPGSRASKQSMRELLCPVFNTHRMVAEYATTFYFPASERFERLKQDNLAQAKTLVDWKNRIRAKWSQLHIEGVETQKLSEDTDILAGQSVHIAAHVQLGELTPADVLVQAYAGPLDFNHQITQGTAIPLTWQSVKDGRNVYEGDIPTTESGMQGFAVRVLPTHSDAALPIELPLITWE